MLAPAVAALLPPARPVASRATLVAIPPERGLPAPHPYAISPDGAVVVGGFSPANGFVYRVAPRSLAHFSPGGAEVYPNAVAAGGRAIVGVAKNAFAWTGGTLRTLAPLRADAASVASGVSADGATAVGYSQSEGGGFRAVRWRRGLATILQPLRGYPDMHARAAARGGSPVVGVAYDAAKSTRAFLWTELVGSRLLVVPHWAADSSAEAITPDGRLAVGSLSARARTAAARWDLRTGGISVLPPLPGATTAVALAVDPAGRYVAGFSGERAAVWNSAAAVQGLGAFLAAHRANVAGWTFEQVVGIGRTGRTVVLTGWGAKNGKSLGFVATFAD